MKVGTDGVLLGAWATANQSKTNNETLGSAAFKAIAEKKSTDKSQQNQITKNCNELIDNCKLLINILDIGTGTGLLSLMMAQRFPTATIHAIEIDSEAAQQASENIAASPFHDRITAIHTSLQDYAPDLHYDTIVCNPPYFINSLQSPDSQRTTARHTDSLTHDQLLAHSAHLLRKGGNLALVLPTAEGRQLLATAPQYGFTATEIVYVHPTLWAEPKRLLINLVYGDMAHEIECRESHLTIELSRHCYTDEYIALTCDFYLKM